MNVSHNKNNSNIFVIFRKAISVIWRFRSKHHNFHFYFQLYCTICKIYYLELHPLKFLSYFVLISPLLVRARVNVKEELRQASNIEKIKSIKFFFILLLWREVKWMWRKKKKEGRQTVQVRTHSGSFHFSYTFFFFDYKKNLFFFCNHIAAKKKKCLAIHARDEWVQVQNRWIDRWIALLDGWMDG